MRLPNANKAVVEQQKITGYLLNAAHPDNGGKAKFFEGLGFRRDDWRVFANALKSLAANGKVQERAPSPHGTKYVIIARLESPSGKRSDVQTIWIVDRGSDVPRLVTAYPYED